MNAALFEDVYELSPMQQGMLFHTLYDPEGDLYFEQSAMTLRGDLDTVLFAQAWQRVGKRHPVLRTSFHWEGLEKPVQMVHSSVEIPVETRDWRGMPRDVQERELIAFVRDDRRRSFDLSRAPLIRIALLRTADDLHECVLSFQHLVLDRWSRYLVVNEVLAVYGCLRRGEAAPLPAPRPYRDYIAWIQERDGAETEAFWRRTLAGFKTATSFLYGGRPYESKSPTFETAVIRLSAGETAGLQSFARRHRLTLNTLVQGAWSLLASRYSGEEDVVFGATVSGRGGSLPDVESMVGLFINSLPVRVQIPPQEGVLAWLQRLQMSLLELRQYEHSSLIDIQSWSEVPRGTPLFESLVVFENVGGETAPGPEAGGLEVTRIRSFGGVTSYPLTLLGVPGPSLSLTLLGDSSLFGPSALSRMLGHLRALLDGMVADPDRPLCELPLLTEAESRLLLHEWNQTGHSTDTGETAHGLFEAQARKTPESTALLFGSERVSYRRLDERASLLADRLRSAGVRAGAPVGVCLDRSPEMIAGVLGILKAGAVCLPLDPAYPEKRLSLLLEDAAPPVVLVDSRSRDLFARLSPAARLLDVGEQVRAEERVADLPGASGPADLAYLLYTSGSSGAPKGVAMGHASLVNLVRWQAGRSDSSAPERTVQFSSLNFDVSFQEIFATLGTGGTLVLISEESRRDSEAFSELLAEAAVERMFLPFVALQLLAEAVSRGARLPSSLRRVITAGEQLRITPEIAALFERLESCSLENQYGPTETHVVTAFLLTGEPREWPALPPIGRPIANARVYILDGHRRPVPIGVAGELHVGGLPLARGYWNSPQRTAERFFPDPFDPNSGSRLYRTGDLARYREDGNIDYLGRADDQVKVRGFRVEPGEIEAVLEQNPSVERAVVVAREDSPGSRRLVAYVVPAGKGEAAGPDLRRFLELRLPEYMIPSDFVGLPALPMTPSGKVDRRALPAPGRRVRPNGGLPPGTAIEKELAEIWKEILKVDRVGLEDNFFELGGHSLLATRAISRVAESFGLRMPLRRIFEKPTLEGFAAALESSLAQAGQAEGILDMLAGVKDLSDEEARLRLASEGRLDREGPQRVS